MTSSPARRTAPAGQLDQRGRVADHADPVAGGQRLAASISPTSNSSATVSTRITPDWATSAATPASSGRRPRAPERPAPVAAPAGDRHDRLVPAQLPGDPGELARVAEGLQVQQHDVGRGSSRQYCSRSLPDTSARLPAETKVDRPSPRASRLGEQRDADARRTGRTPRSGRGAGSRGARVALRRTAGSVLTRPRAVRPDQPHAVRPGRRHEGLPAPRCPAGPSSANPAETHHQPRATPAAAGIGDARPAPRPPARPPRPGPPGSGADQRSEAVSPSTSARCWVDRVDGPGEAALTTCRSSVAPSAGAVAADAVDRDGRGASSRAIERASACCSRPADLDATRGRRDRETSGAPRHRRTRG